jgi:putative ABC transport system substrate-binding protein
VFKAKSSDQIDAAFAALSDVRSDARFVAAGAFFNEPRVQLAILAARHAFSTAYGARDYPEAGGLMSYGPTFRICFVRLCGSHS